MAQQQEDQLYDIYLLTFGKSRAGGQVSDAELREPGTRPGHPLYTGRELAAAIRGIVDGKGSGLPLKRRDLHSALDEQLT